MCIFVVAFGRCRRDIAIFIPRMEELNLQWHAWGFDMKWVRTGGPNFMLDAHVDTDYGKDLTNHLKR